MLNCHLALCYSYTMLDSQKKRRINQFLYHKVTLVILFILVIIILRSTWTVYQKKVESENIKNISLNYERGLQARSDELQAQMDSLQTEAGQEAEIRSKFSVAKENENVVVVVDEATTAKSTTTPVSLWQKFINLFR